MATNDVPTIVAEIAGRLVASLQMELVDIEYRREGRDMVLRLFIDKEGGVTLDDCSSVSRELSEILDVENVIQERYTLEVSSPGLNRPLKKEKDFLRYIGSLIRVRTFELLEDDRGNRRKTFLGELVAFDNGIVRMKLKEGQTAGIPLEKVAKANLEFDF